MAMIAPDTLYYALWDGEAEADALQNATANEAHNRANGYTVPTLSEYGDIESDESE